LKDQKLLSYHKNLKEMTFTGLLLLIATIALGVTLLINFLIQKPGGIQGWVFSYLRYFLAVFFLFSGIVKAIDPKGTAYKMEDYFAVFSEYLPALNPLWNWSLGMSLPISAFMIILEIVLGITLLLGILQRTTLLLYAGLLAFFTFLTGFTAITNKVTDCGCFGDFLKLAPLQSFQKDIFLVIILAVIIFMYRKHLKPLFNAKIGWGLLVVLAIVTVWFNIKNINHLPVKDFRAYAAGTDLRKCISMEGLNPGKKEIYYNMENTTSGEKKEVESREYMSSRIWEDKNWQIVGDTREVVIEEAEMPKCKDFSIENAAGDEIHNDILNDTGYSFFIGAYYLDKASKEGFKVTNELMRTVKQKGVKVYGLTASSIEEGNRLAENVYQFNNIDAIPIKTMVRSNPGLVLIKDGKVLQKWHYNDVPSIEDLKAFGI